MEEKQTKYRIKVVELNSGEIRYYPQIYTKDNIYANQCEWLYFISYAGMIHIHDGQYYGTDKEEFRRKDAIYKENKELAKYVIKKYEEDRIALKEYRKQKELQAFNLQIKSETFIEL